MSPIIPALIFALMAAANEQEQQQSGDDILKRKDVLELTKLQLQGLVKEFKRIFEDDISEIQNFQKNLKNDLIRELTSNQRIFRNEISSLLEPKPDDECDISNRNKDTVYIFKPSYNAYSGLPGLHKEIAANSSVKCIKNDNKDS